MLHYDGEPVSQPKPAALKTDKKTLDWINKEERVPLDHRVMVSGRKRDCRVTLRVPRNDLPEPAWLGPRPEGMGRADFGKRVGEGLPWITERKGSLFVHRPF